MDLAQFDYTLPEELIAQTPLADRAASRMLVVHRREGRWEDREFRDLPQYLKPGDWLVLNDSKVFPCRLFGSRKDLEGKVEIFLLRPISADARQWQALVRPGRKMRVGERILCEGGLEAEILSHAEFGERTLRFADGPDVYEQLDQHGHVPLPPYIKRPDDPLDRHRYQTVFARERGSVAAPTAGLHFTPGILGACRVAGAGIAYVTLHVGLGTFQPLHAATVEENHLHAEFYAVSEDNAAKIRAAGRAIGVGTTSVRTIETVARSGNLAGSTDLYIYPGFEFRATGGMLTNFHLPRTSLLLLVCAFAGTELALAAYRHAVEERYRFYSYGDCMLIL
jgi:S-adenosylmethionine:tRNA ribosyltransferase-isomerase